MSRDVILVIDDEPELLELVSYNLKQAGYDVLTAGDGPSGVRVATTRLPNLIILDLMLPGMDGLSVCQQLRSASSTAAIPIVMLTAKGSETDRVVGLELGADDYVVKPFSPRELVARVRAVLRRGNEALQSAAMIEHGPLRIDRNNYRVTFDGSEITLTLAEFEILRFLASNPDRVLNREQIIDGALGREVVVTDRNVDVHVGAIRRKLGRGRHHLQTIRGVGYRFAPSPD